MHFNLIKGDLLSELTCNGIDDYSTVKVNISYIESINLPTTSYTFTDTGDFIIFGWNYGLKKRILANSHNKGLYLKLEKIDDEDKLALVDSQDQHYYYHYNSRYGDVGIVTEDSIRSVIRNGYIYTYDFTRCKDSYLQLKDSKVFVDPKDVMSSKNMHSILDDLRKSPNKKLRIGSGEKFLKQLQLNHKNADVYDFFDKKIGILNNIVLAYNVDNEELQLFCQALDETKILKGKLFNYFKIEKLNNSYVGCLSDESYQCKDFYSLTPESFVYDNSNLHPYYYYLENMYDSFYNMKVSVNFKDFEELRQRVRGLEELIGWLEGLTEEHGFGISKNLVKSENLKKRIEGLESNIYVLQSIIDQVRNETIKGEKGDSGIPGLPGIPGLYGLKGEPGTPGLPGRDGNPGGPKGNVGHQGPRGYRGAPGISGQHGLVGFPGQKGEKGEQGIPGVSVQSSPGLPGVPGIDGTPGVKGDKGNVGPVGPQGKIGMPGPKGSQGERGNIGPEGKKGERGAKGDSGSPGVNGKPGMKGEQGIKGGIGSPGKRGWKGEPGKPGDTGRQGSKGEPGRDGLSGLKGDIGPVGPQGLEGKNGMSGTKGDRGEPGTEGKKGEKGDTGLPGKDADPKEVVNELTTTKLKELIFNTTDSNNRTLTEKLANSSELQTKVMQNLLNDKAIMYKILEYRNEDGDLLLEQQVVGGLIDDKGFHREVANSLFYNKNQELVDSLINVTNQDGKTLIEKLANDVELRQSVADKLSQNPGKIQGPKGDKGEFGLPGILGAKGEIGYPGAPGQKGDKGDTGSKGSDGVPGKSGEKGEMGPHGLKGEPGVLGIKGDRGEPGISGQPGEKGIKGEIGIPGKDGSSGEKGDKGDMGIKGVKGSAGLHGFKGEPGEKGSKGETGVLGINGVPGKDGLPGPKGEIGPVGPMGPEGKIGISGSKGDRGEPGISGQPGEKGIRGEVGLPGKDGLSGEKGDRGDMGIKGVKGSAGLHGFKGEPGEQGSKGERGDIGLPGADGLNAKVADQFLSEINQTKIEIKNAQKEVETNKNATESFAKEAQDAKNETKSLHNDIVKLKNMAEIARGSAKKFAGEALQSKQDAEALSGNIEDIFCKIKPADQVCSASRGKREIKKVQDFGYASIASGASKPISLISNIANFFYSFIGQDEYKLENKMQELNQAAKAVYAADIIMKFEKALEETAANCGIRRKNLDFNPIELQLTLIDKKLLDNDNKLLEALREAAKKACSNCSNKFLSLFENNMKKALVDNKQLRDFANIKKVSIDNEQPRNFIDNAVVTNSSNVYAIDNMLIRYLN